MADSGELDPQLVRQIDALDQNLIEPSENGEMLDGFVNMYRQLPEFPFSQVLGGDISVELMGENSAWLFRAVAAYKNSMVVRDLSEQRSSQDMPAYRLLRGSFYIPECDVEVVGEEEVAKAIQKVVSYDSQFVGYFTVDDYLLRTAYLPSVFCREAFLIHQKACTLEEIRTKKFKSRSARNPVEGQLITIQPQPNQPLTLFVEDELEVTNQVHNAYWRVGNDYQPILSFVDENEED